MGYIGQTITTVFPTSISVDSATISGNASVGGTLGVTGVSTLSDNIVFDASSKGVHLGVTSATASNLLDDFEEGLFTLVADASGVNLTQNSGRYTKIGQMVYITGIIAFPSTSSSDNAEISGFPFACGSGNQSRGGFAFGFNNKGDNNFTFLIGGGSSVARLVNLSGQTMATSNFSSKTFVFGGAYLV